MEMLVVVATLIGSLLLIFMLLVAPRLTMWILVIGSFLLIVGVVIYVKGFPKGLVEGIAYGGFFSLLFWSGMEKKFADTARARAWLTANSPATCTSCGTKLSYHRVPKNLSQLLLGGWTCPNCGAESAAHIDMFKFR
jgi:predicted membrane channel-forming protein YqfA (hemolysin III family)